jgi:hypothetical protein
VEGSREHGKAASQEGLIFMMLVNNNASISIVRCIVIYLPLYWSFLICVVGGGVQLGPLGTAATNGLCASPG